MGEKWLTTEQVAERYQLSKASVWEHVRSGKLPAHRLGRVLRFDPVEVDAAIRGGQVAIENPSIGGRVAKVSAR